MYEMSRNISLQHIIISSSSYWSLEVPWLAFVICIYLLSLYLLDFIRSLHRADECKSFLICQHRRVHKLELIWVRPYIYNKGKYVLFVLLRWSVRWCCKWAYSSCFMCAASRICSKYHVASMCSTHRAFYPCLLIDVMWCFHTIVLNQP